MTRDTIAVILGAHDFPDTTFASTDAFTHSARLVKAYLSLPEWLAVPPESILDLFDSTEPAARQLDIFEAFLAKSMSREELPKITRLILYYIGHGTFPKGEYCLAVRSSKKSSLARSSIRFRDLADSLMAQAKSLQSYLILDACFAAKGTSYFMADALEVVKQDVDSSSIGTGVTMYCSSPSEKPSYYLPDESATAFTSAFIKALQGGVETGPQLLSLLDIEPVTWNALQTIGNDARLRDPFFAPARPEIHTPRRVSEDIARLRFFPNPAYSGPSTSESELPAVVRRPVVPSGDGHASLTIKEARRIIKDIPEKAMRSLDQLFAVLELYCCRGNCGDDHKVQAFIHRKFEDPVILEAKALGEALKAAQLASDALIVPEDDDVLFKYRKVETFLEPLLKVLPTKSTCYTLFSNESETVVAAFLVIKYFSDDLLYHNQCVFDVIENLQLGQECRVLLEDNIGRWSWPSIYSRQIATIGVRDLGEEFERMFKRIRGKSRQEVEEEKAKEEEERRLKDDEEQQKRGNARRAEEEQARLNEETKSAHLSSRQLQNILRRLEQHLSNVAAIEKDYKAKWPQVEPLCSVVRESIKDLFPYVAFRIHDAQRTFASVTDILRVLKTELQVLKERLHAHEPSKRSRLWSLLTVLMVLIGIFSSIAIVLSLQDTTNKADNSEKPSTSAQMVGMTLLDETDKSKSKVEGSGEVSIEPILHAPFGLTDAQTSQKALATSRGINVVTKNKIGVEMVLIPPGEFVMGSEDSAEDLLKLFPKEFPKADRDAVGDAQPSRKTRITRPFLLGKHEVTIGQFRQFTDEVEFVTEAESDRIGGYGYEKGSWKRDVRFNWRNCGFDPKPSDDHPVVNISWNDAVEFCNWLSEKEEKTKYYRIENGGVSVVGGTGYRLPTESEWEYSCRAGTISRYYNGSEPEGLVLIGNTWDAKAKTIFPSYDGFVSGNDGYVFTSPVGQFEPNNFGLKDMSGNAFEWCGDWYAKGYDVTVRSDPVGATEGSCRVFRGGCWNYSAVYCRSADRHCAKPNEGLYYLGFRLAADLADQVASVLPSNSGFEGTKAGDAKELVPGIFFRWCPSGTFTMGSPKSELGHNGKREDDEDQVSVTLTKGYWLGEMEVTQGQWRKIMMTTPWEGKSDVTEGVNVAATYISYDAAKKFAETLTTQERKAGRLPSGWKYSLPTEAQWEYACRAGTKTKYSFGDDDANLREYGWFEDNSEKHVHEVGKREPNAWRLLDMHGNVWEWCIDWYDTKLQGGRDPQGPATGSKRVYRGGSWYFEASYCRSANRYGDPPDSRLDYLGFRLAAVPE